MAQRQVGITDVASAGGVADYRVRERTVESVSVAEQYLIPVRWRVPSFVGMASTFRTTAAAVNVHLSTISNAAGSSVLVAVRAIDITGTNLTNSASSRFMFLTQHAAVPTAGVNMTKVSVGTGADAAETSSSSVLVKGTNSADAGALTAITLAAGTRVGAASGVRLATLVGQTGIIDTSFGPTGMYLVGPPTKSPPPTHGGAEAFLIDNPYILRAGESLAVSYESATTGSHLVASWLWEEYTLP